MDIEKTKDELKADIILGRLKAHQIEEAVFSRFDKNPEKYEDAVALAEEIRAEYFEDILGVNLGCIKKPYVNTAMLKETEAKEMFMTKGIELKIGTAKIPFSIAGPLAVKSLNENVSSSFYVPIATNEAALVAGLQRGIKCINKACGINVVVEDVGMARAPLLEAKDIQSAKEFSQAINSGRHNADFRKIVDGNSLYTKFKSARAYQMMDKVWARFVFATDEAMGMNSAVKHTSAILKFLLERYDLKLLSLTGNLCCDKKPSSINILEGRGKKADTEIIIPEKIIREVYGEKTSAWDIVHLNHWKNYAGSALAGTTSGFNANAANTVAGIFAATGQDLAQVVESSSCFTHAEIVEINSNGKINSNGDKSEKGLKFGVSMPCLEVGAVGGGTLFGTAKEALGIVLSSMENNINEGLTKSMMLAGVIASAVTAQELNLLCTLVNEFELCSSHICLARGEREKRA